MRAHARGGRAPARAGFTLVEVTLMLAIVSLVAVLALPRAVPGGSASLRVKAHEIAAILRADRDEAVRTGRPVISVIDLASAQVRSGGFNGAVTLSDRFTLDVSAQALDGVRFAPDGTTSGGAVFVSRAGEVLSVTVNAVTAAVTIARPARDDR